jgi:hypothetical protein
MHVYDKDMSTHRGLVDSAYMGLWLKVRHGMYPASLTLPMLDILDQYIISRYWFAHLTSGIMIVWVHV